MGENVPVLLTSDFEEAIAFDPAPDADAEEAEAFATDVKVTDFVLLELCSEEDSVLP